MSTRIERDLGFSTAIHFADQFLLNEYIMTLSILVETDDYKEQNVALERILTLFCFGLTTVVVFIKMMKHQLKNTKMEALGFVHYQKIQSIKSFR